MATHQITIAKASKNDFEKVYNLLSPMEELFNNRWSNEESWTEWDDDNEDKLELLATVMRMKWTTVLSYTSLLNAE